MEDNFCNCCNGFFVVLEMTKLPSRLRVVEEG
jgi:hypothetical protein